MNKEEIKEGYELLNAVCHATDKDGKWAYMQMRELLERLCRTQLPDGDLQMTDLSARISFAASRLDLSRAEQNRLHTFRLTSNDILNHRAEPDKEKLLRDAKTLAFFLKCISKEDIPESLYKLLPKKDNTYLLTPPTHEKVEKMRVCFEYADDEYLYVIPVDSVSEEALRVKYNVEQINDFFSETCEQLWPHCRLNLLDVSIDPHTQILTPGIIVLEPDYLIDISSLAECFKDYGHHPANYLLARLKPIENAMPLLIGNIANLFLDEWIYSESEPDYMECMKKAFRQYPIELAACSELLEPGKARDFADACKNHFNRLKETVNVKFKESGYDFDKTTAVLEPSYICEALGLQGRLDYMQQDMSKFIEMKSGKADEFTQQPNIVPRENNMIQMMLYHAVLHYSMKQPHQKVKPYLLYTRYPLLYPARPNWSMLKRTIDLRNRIVAEEFGIQLRNSIHYTEERLKAIDADVLNEKNIRGRFWENYLRPEIDKFKEALVNLSSTEKAYFYMLYNFITKELYTSKSGDVDYDSRRGASALWNSTLTEKNEAGEILYDLSISKNEANLASKAKITFDIPSNEEDERGLPNFRKGDAIVLYERNGKKDNATNKMVFKGNIEEITDTQLTVRLRATQHNTAVIPEKSLYAIERDSMDTTFRHMYTGLYHFMTANKERRDLLLSKRAPQIDATYSEKIKEAKNDFDRATLKALAAKDYFLLIGPPGTGKTSWALRQMVESFHANPEAQILLLSYTNRAVDEICKMLTSIQPQIDFIRIGSELSCEPAYRPYLIENVLKSCDKRADVVDRIGKCRVIVGTVAAISGKPELFKLKRFDVAIVDEATQILEPQLIGILCARTPQGANAIGKFILIGDHKQLPAVVLQSAEKSEIYEPELQEIGLLNLKDSLFERLYNTLRKENESESIQENPFCDMLSRQGRMHPEVARLANEAFYHNRLHTVGLPHQTETESTYERTIFIPSKPEPMGGQIKINHDEACIVAKLAKEVFERESKAGIFDITKTLGIITPYRSQIALIRKEIARLDIPELQEIAIDTVERYQGSERDVIIYSFSVNTTHQLKYLPNITEDEGVIIDRKLNVALTRARKQLFITGVKEILEMNPIYQNLIKQIEKAT